MSPIRPLQRTEWIALAAAFVAVVLLGRSFSAQDVSAKTPTLSAARDRAQPSNVAPLKHLVTLIGADHLVRVESRSGVTVYTVSDRSGNVLAEHLSQEELAERFPALVLDELHAQTRTLMLADPRE